MTEPWKASWLLLGSLQEGLIANGMIFSSTSTQLFLSFHPWVTAGTASPVFLGSPPDSQAMAHGWLATSNAVYAAVKPCVSFHL